MGLDLTSFDAALKSHYTDDRVENAVYADNPLLALMPKMERFGGRDLPIPIIYGNPQGRSRTFTNAQTRGAATSSRVTDFVLLRKKDYSLATIDNETLEASKDNADAFLDAATTEIDGAIQAASNNLAQSIYRKSSGARGQVLAEPSTNSGTFVVTMKNRGDIASIELDMMIVIYSAESGGSGGSAVSCSSGSAPRRSSRSASPSASMVVSIISPRYGALISRTPCAALVQRDSWPPPPSDQTLNTLP